MLALLARLTGFIALLALTISPLLLIESQVAQLTLGVAVFTIVLAVWSRFADQSSLAHYGLSFEWRFFGELFTGLGIATFAVSLIFAAGLLAGTITAPRMEASYPSESFWLFGFRMGLVGFWEELLFRGFLYWTLLRGLAPSIGIPKATITAVVFSSLLFGLAHTGTSNFSAAPLLILTLNGAVLALPVWLTGRLGYSIGIHAAWNFSQSKIFGFPMSGNPPSDPLIAWSGSGPAWWTGGAYGPESGVSGVLALLLIAGIVYWKSRARTPGDNA